MVGIRVESVGVVKIQVYLDGVVGERLAVRAKGERRSVSAMAALLIEQALSGPSGVPVRTEATGRVVVEAPRVPPESVPVERAARVEQLQQQVPGVQTASRAFPAVPQDLARQVTPRPRGGR